MNLEERDVQLASWMPGGTEWLKDGCWRLEQPRDRPELLPIKAGELTLATYSYVRAPLHFVDGLAELYPTLAFSAYTVDLCDMLETFWVYRAEEGGLIAVEAFGSCWEGEEVSYWKIRGQVMIDQGKPVAEEVRDRMPFIVIDGKPTPNADAPYGESSETTPPIITEEQSKAVEAIWKN